MEPLQVIKARIASVASTRQITRSMRLVSTSKVQRARWRMEENRGFLEEARQLARIAARGAVSRAHRYLGEPSGGKTAVIVIAGDRGLCGGYNINVNREAVRLVRPLESPRIVTIGAKACDFWRRRRKAQIAGSFTGISENPFYDDAEEIAHLVREWYDRGEVNQVYMVSTEFESMLVQTPISRRLLPLEPGGGETGGLIRCEPAGDEFLEAVIPFYLTACVFGAILESSACEQSARITSMDAAVRNSDEIIEKLTLRYNQARQSAITQELVEIAGGAEAIRDNG